MKKLFIFLAILCATGVLADPPSNPADPVTTSGTQTLTNKTIGGATNTVDADTVAATTPTTAGLSFLGLTNPGAITFPRINADNTVTALSAANFMTALGGTTVGQSLFTLTNPGAITFLRINADNTVTARSAANFLTDIGALPLAGGTMTGHLLFTDNTYDIGASGATRPRDIFVADDVVAAGDGTFSGAVTGLSINGMTITTSSGTFTLTDSKVFSVTNTLTLSGTDGSTLNIGTGGTLGSNAYTSTSYLPIGGGTMTGALLFTDNSIDIGASGLTRPRTGYFGTSLISPVFSMDGDAGDSGGVRLQHGSAISWENSTPGTDSTITTSSNDFILTPVGNDVYVKSGAASSGLNVEQTGGVSGNNVSAVISMKGTDGAGNLASSGNTSHIGSAGGSGLLTVNPAFAVRDGTTGTGTGTTRLSVSGSTIAVTGTFGVTGNTTLTGTLKVTDVDGGADAVIFHDDSADKLAPLSGIRVSGTAFAGIAGTTTNDSATAGDVGELTSSTLGSGTPVSLSSATVADVTSISLTAGDWDISGAVGYLMTSATATDFISGWHTVSATLPTNYYQTRSRYFDTATTTYQVNQPIARRRLSISGTTTVYLVGRCTFSAGTVDAYGFIEARRVR